MKRVFSVLIASCLGFAASPAAAERSWAVQAGDTLGEIARRFAVSQRDLRAWNDLEGDLLRIGQVLRLDGPDGPARPPAAPARADAPREPGAPDSAHGTYRVQAGDTLSGIADRVGAKLDDLLAWNPSLDPDRIRAGQTLTVGDQGRRVEYRVNPGETLSAIARRYRVTQTQLTRWNPGLSPDRLRAGQLLSLYTRVPASRSESIGTPSDGELKHAARLSPHRAYRIRDRNRAWGTEEVVRHLRAAFDRVLSAFPRGPRVEVHDLSHRDGGPMTHHRSHQSGRDVDIAYFRQGCRGKACGFNRIGKSDLDVARQWALLKHWLERDVLEAVFIDYGLQAALYRHARREGASADQLNRWFQYPRGRTYQLGIIRHFPKHADHMHVRFACHETDKACKTFRPLLMGTRHAQR